MVEIEIMDSKCYSKQLDVAYGRPKNPGTWQDLTDKFRDCASYSPRSLPKERIEKAIDMASQLEEVDDVNRIVEIVT